MKRYLLLGLSVLIATVLTSRQDSWGQGPIAATAAATLSPTPSAILTVNTLDDLDTGKCDVSKCSLRDAVAVAPAGATINFMQGLTGSIALNTVIVIEHDITIQGPGPTSNALTLTTPTPTHEIFQIGGLNPIVHLNTLTFAEASMALNIYHGRVTVNDSTFTHNGTLAQAAVVNSGSLYINNSTFRNNHSDSHGGAIENFGAMIILNSTFQDNHTDDDDPTSPGAIYSSGSASIYNSTFQGNSKGRSPSIWVNPNTSFSNTILEGVAGSPTCFGSLLDGGGNLQYPHTDCGNSIRVGDPKLGPLADNGGPTWTKVLLPGSAAVGLNTAENCPRTDQRGMALPQDSSCDSGAFQHLGVTPTLSLSPTSPVTMQPASPGMSTPPGLIFF